LEEEGQILLLFYLASFNSCYWSRYTRETDSTYCNHPLYNGASCYRSNEHDVAHSWKSTRLLQPPHIWWVTLF